MSHFLPPVPLPPLSFPPPIIPPFPDITTQAHHYGWQQTPVQLPRYHRWRRFLLDDAHQLRLLAVRAWWWCGGTRWSDCEAVGSNEDKNVPNIIVDKLVGFNSSSTTFTADTTIIISITTVDHLDRITLHQNFKFPIHSSDLTAGSPISYAPKN